MWTVVVILCLMMFCAIGCLTGCYGLLWGKRDFMDASFAGVFGAVGSTLAIWFPILPSSWPQVVSVTGQCLFSALLLTTVLRLVSKRNTGA